MFFTVDLLSGVYQHQKAWNSMLKQLLFWWQETGEQFVDVDTTTLLDQDSIASFVESFQVALFSFSSN